MTLKELVELERIQWKLVEKELSQTLAEMGEPPIYTNRINSLRRGYQPTGPERAALIKWTDGAVEDFRDDPMTPFRRRRFSS